MEAIPEIVEAIGKLLASGAAYRADDPEYPDVYFDRNASGHFGYESNYDIPTMTEFFAERGGDPDRVGKRDPLDALLWRMARPGEPSWESELGAGRPGWHIECSAIALNRLGDGFDVQAAGPTWCFPHTTSSAPPTSRGRPHRQAPRHGPASQQHRPVRCRGAAGVGGRP
ncbi:hypothetical protein GCM10018954_036090 [Kutzneria kofuensis]